MNTGKIPRLKRFVAGSNNALQREILHENHTMSDNKQPAPMLTTAPAYSRRIPPLLTAFPRMRNSNPRSETLLARNDNFHPDTANISGVFRATIHAFNAVVFKMAALNHPFKLMISLRFQREFDNSQARPVRLKKIAQPSLLFRYCSKTYQKPPRRYRNSFPYHYSGSIGSTLRFRKNHP